MKIRNVCLNGTRIFKDYEPAGKNEINARSIIWFFKAGSF